MSPARSQGRELPVRSIADVRLSEAVDGDECPLCVVRRAAGTSYLKSLLAEGVTDPQTRAELRAARGFCRPHTHELLGIDRAESGAPLGAAILLEAALGWRLDELGAAREERERARRRRRAAAPSPDCPVCAHVDESVERASSDIAGWLADEAWRERLASAAFCIDDLLLVWSAAGSDAATPILDRQLERMNEIRTLLDRYVHHSSQDRRHLQTDDERRAVERAARLLGGDDRR